MTREELVKALSILGARNLIKTPFIDNKGIRDAILAEFDRLTDRNEVYRWYVREVEVNKKLAEEHNLLCEWIEELLKILMELGVLPDTSSRSS